MSLQDARQLPGPRPVPLLGARGNLLAFMRDPVNQLRRLHCAYGDMVALARGSPKYILVFGPAYNQQVLSDTALFAALDSSASPLAIRRGSALARLSRGLTQMNGAQHQRHRQLMQPAFQRRCILGYAQDIVVLAERAAGSLVAGEQIDLLATMRQLTLGIAIKTLVGLDPNCDGRGLNQLLAQWLSLVFSLAAVACPLPIPGTPYFRLLRLSEALEVEIGRMVRRRRVMDAQGNDVLSLLLQARDEAGTGLTDADLVAQTATLFVAGHEITARVLTWTLLLLALHPAVLASIQAELSICLHGAPPTAAQLSRAPGLERVLKESLRLLPPILWWGRVATRACALGEYRVPAGTHVVFSPFITHRLASVYSQPDRFLPDRWADTEPAPYTFIPFSGGPRMCLGAAYAMLEMKLILAVLVQRVRFEPMPEARVDRGGLLFSEPRGGLRVRVCSPDVPACAVSIRGNIRELVALVPE